MQIHKVNQGSPEWLVLRTQYFTASEALAMMGASSYMSRSQLLAQKHTGLAKEVDAATQRRFDAGHATEAAFRPIAEEIVGDDLYPCTGSIEIDGLKLLSSFDGLTMDYQFGFEHKLLNQQIADDITFHGEPGPAYYWQLEQQLLVSGADKILFVTSNGAKENSVTCWYESKPERRAALIAGWKQFAEDLANYVPEASVAPAPTGRAPETLPALRIEVTGMVTASNLAEFKQTALAAIRSVNRTLETDQDFADAEQSVKWCGDVESRLKAAKEHALSQTASIDELFKTLDDLGAEARQVRLDLEKLVKNRKEAIRGEIVASGVSGLAEHIARLNQRLGRPLVPAIPADFGGAIKGKRSIDSIRDAVDTELARAKIAASEIADRIEVNVKSLADARNDWAFLFPDLAAVATKTAEDFANLLSARVSKFQQDQEDARRRAEQLEQARQQREAEARAAAAQVVQQAAQVTTMIIHPTSTLAEELAKPAPNTGNVPLRRGELGVIGGAIRIVDTGARIKLGEINSRIAPLSITADVLASLGFEPVATAQNAKLYRESDFRQMCLAISNHMLQLVDAFDGVSA